MRINDERVAGYHKEHKRKRLSEMVLVSREEVHCRFVRPRSDRDLCGNKRDANDGRVLFVRASCNRHLRHAPFTEC
jgi:hypothetical protein